MKRTLVFLAAIFFNLIFSSNAYAQMDEREPGLYAIVGDQSIPLIYSNGTTAVSATGILGVEIGKKKCSYKGVSSGVIASDTFVMVINPEKRSITKTPKSYFPFIKTMTPDNILILPLVVKNNKRVYEEGLTISGLNVTIKDRMDFEWEQISENSFEIKVKHLIPGEYGFIFRVSKLAEFDYAAIYGFTYPQESQE